MHPKVLGIKGQDYNFNPILETPSFPKDGLHNTILSSVGQPQIPSFSVHLLSACCVPELDTQPWTRCVPDLRPSRADRLHARAVCML